MSIFVISDLEFETEIKTKKIIDNWNSTIKKNDSVLIFGKLNYSIEDIEKYFPQLNGKLYLTQYNKNKNFSKDELIKSGFHRIVDLEYVYGEQIIFPLIKNFTQETGKYYLITQIDGADKVFSNNRLSIEGKYWDNIPINVQSIEGIIERLEEAYNNES